MNAMIGSLISFCFLEDLSVLLLLLLLSESIGVLGAEIERRVRKARKEVETGIEIFDDLVLLR